MSQMGRFGTGSTPPPPGTAVQTLTGNSGGAVGPDGANNINVVGDGSSITVAGNPGTNTLTISTAGEVAVIYQEDAGIASATGGVLNVIGGANINTIGITNNIEIALNTTISQPNTNALGDEGMYLLGGNNFLHNYGTENTFLGNNAGNLTLNVGSAFANTALGDSALTALTTSANNTAVGAHALEANTTGQSNTAVGAYALTNNTTGQNNVAVGLEALTSCSSGQNNVGVGVGALQNQETGLSCIAIGVEALSLITDGDFNIAIGDGAGEALTTNDSSNIIIGNIGTAGDNNTIRIGTNGAGLGQQDKCYIAGIANVNVGSVASVVSISGNQLGQTTITGGTGISITPGANTITISATSFSNIVNYTAIDDTDSPYAVTASDYYISADSTAGTVTVQLPNAPSTGRVFAIKDQAGTSATNNITVTTVGGAVNIDGSTSFVMNTAYESIQVIFNGSAYEVY